jgi:hypothetical protein
MYERAYGSKYDRSLSRVDIAKAIRADIKEAVKAGKLPESAKYSVQSRSYAGGFSIDIRVKNFHEAYVVCDGFAAQSPEQEALYGKRLCGNYWCSERNDSEHAKPHDRLSWEAVQVEEKLKAIAWAYNFDGSDSQRDYFDVNFYSHVDIESARDAEFQAQHVAAKKAAAAARQ